jgi:hypothetical protein
VTISQGQTLGSSKASKRTRLIMLPLLDFHNATAERSRRAKATEMIKLTTHILHFDRSQAPSMVLAHTHHLIPSFRIPPQKAKHWLVLGYGCRDYQTRILLQKPWPLEKTTKQRATYNT